MSDISITDAPENNRFEATIDGKAAGFVEYVLGGKTIILAHTEVDPAFEGQGIGSELARAVLDSIRERGGPEVIPTCPFINGFIAKNPEYVDLVTPAMRSQFS